MSRTSITSEDLDDLSIDDITQIFDDLTYNGFDLNGMRKKFLVDKNGGDIELNVAVNHVMITLISLSKAGNNHNKLINKVKSKKTGIIVKSKLKEIGVKAKAIASNDITLTRTGIAFVAPYIMLRRIAKDKLQQAVRVNLDVVFMDLAFSGVKEINSMRGYKEFYLAFGKLIKRDDDSDDEEGEIKEQKKKRSKRGEKTAIIDDPWITVAMNGFDSDYSDIKLDVMKAIRNLSPTLDDIKNSIKLIFELIAPSTKMNIDK